MTVDDVALHQRVRELELEAVGLEAVLSETQWRLCAAEDELLVERGEISREQADRHIAAHRDASDFHVGRLSLKALSLTRTPEEERPWL